jgi:copper resistance protein D
MSPELASVLLAGCRWLTYAAVLAMVGSAGARHVTARVSSEQFVAIRPALHRQIDRLAAIASIAWVLALALTFAAQVTSWFGARALLERELMQGMLFRTKWGEAWLISGTSAVGAVIAHAVAVVWRPGRPAVVFLAPVAAILTTPLLGHAAGRGSLSWSLHATHLLGTGIWLGTLLMLALPTRALWRDGSRSAALVRNMLQAFTPVALTGAALTIATGVFIAAEHIWPLATILKSSYGLTLTVKIVFVALIAVLGWINWRRLRPAADLDDRRRQLRRAVVAELAIAFVIVLAVAAWLSGLPMPMETGHRS